MINVHVNRIYTYIYIILHLNIMYLYKLNMYK
jgi:hypothetical protein